MMISTQTNTYYKKNIWQKNYEYSEKSSHSSLLERKEFFTFSSKCSNFISNGSSIISLLSILMHCIFSAKAFTAALRQSSNISDPVKSKVFSASFLISKSVSYSRSKFWIMLDRAARSFFKRIKFHDNE